MLSTTAIAPVTYALPRARRPGLPATTFFMSSDAAKDGTVTPALAGYMHSLCWQYIYPASWKRLHISI